MIPESEETKPRDRRAFNAYRHGLTGQVLVITPAEQAAYEKHCKGIHESLVPRDAMETDLVQSIADDRWRLKRAAAMESNIFALGINRPAERTGHEQSDAAFAMAHTWLDHSKELERLTLYESRLQRRVEKNLALLRQLRKDRAQAAPPPMEEVGKKTPKRPETRSFPAETGPQKFVFSNNSPEHSPQSQERSLQPV